MNKYQNKIYIAIGILGLIASIYMIISNLYFAKNFSIVAIAAGLLSPLFSYVYMSSGKSK